MLKRFDKGDVVKHFKREISDVNNNPNIYTYEILGFAMHTETEEELVIYKALYGERKCYARPVVDFFSKVDREKYPDIKQEYRFEKL